MSGTKEGGIKQCFVRLLKLILVNWLKQFYKKPWMIKVTPLPPEVAIGGDADATWYCNTDDCLKCFYIHRNAMVFDLIEKTPYVLAGRIFMKSTIEGSKTL